MKISVIIPIYDAEKYLEDLFFALDSNEFIDGDEVLLIDNGSRDNSISLCNKQAERRPALYKVLSYTEKAGSYAARNYGVRNAKGDILIFTDSDTKPVPEWIQVIRNSIAAGIVIAGKIELEIVDKNNVWEHFDNIAHLNSEISAKSNKIATANMAVLKDDFFRVGLFEERFSGGDYEWSERSSKAGLTILFTPKAKVYHPTRKSFAQILKKEQRIAYGTGNHYKLAHKSIVTLTIIYFLKIFKFSTNIRYHKRLRERGFNQRQLIKFQVKFFEIRFEQIKYVIKGYFFEEVRSKGIQ